MNQIRPTLSSVCPELLSREGRNRARIDARWLIFQFGLVSASPQGTFAAFNNTNMDPSRTTKHAVDYGGSPHRQPPADGTHQRQVLPSGWQLVAPDDTKSTYHRVLTDDGTKLGKTRMDFSIGTPRDLSSVNVFMQAACLRRIQTIGRTFLPATSWARKLSPATFPPARAGMRYRPYRCGSHGYAAMINLMNQERPGTSSPSGLSVLPHVARLSTSANWAPMLTGSAP
jgi:hypothetical protein